MKKMFESATWRECQSAENGQYLVDDLLLRQVAAEAEGSCCAKGASQGAAHL